MNVFVLDKDPKFAAQFQCDKHVVKMVTEAAQLLSTAHHIRGTELAKEGGLYRACYINHPWAKWSRIGQYNYNWLLYHAIALGEEYTFRYGKVHKSSAVINRIMDWCVQKGYVSTGGFERSINAVDSGPLCVRSEDQYSRIGRNGRRGFYPRNIVAAYRSYYKYKNTVMDMRWTGRETPIWFSDILL